MTTDKRDEDRDHNDQTADRAGSTTTIYVNTREKTVQGKEVTYEQIVALAFSTPPTGANVEITVVYRDAPGPNKDGSLLPGTSMRVKKGTIFDVTATDKS